MMYAADMTAIEKNPSVPVEPAAAPNVRDIAIEIHHVAFEDNYSLNEIIKFLATSTSSDEDGNKPGQASCMLQELDQILSTVNDSHTKIMTIRSMLGMDK